MKNTPPISRLTGLAIALCACGLFHREEDDPGTTDAHDTGSTSEACVDAWTATLDADACPYPMSPIFTADFAGGSVLWIDDPANATTVGPGGWLFGNTAAADWLGYMIEGDTTCGIACVVPQGHPCFSEGNQFCVGGLDDEQNPGCLYCGQATAEECESFVMNACPGSGGSPTGGADTTAGPDPDGGADSTGASEDAPSIPDTSMFTQHPDQSFGTTRYVLDRLGPYEPPNLVAENVCDVWEPASVVDEQLDETIVDRAALMSVLDRPELLLGFCDGLGLSMTHEGVELHGVRPGTLAAVLGFREQDVLVSLDGVAATDLGGLLAEVVSLSEQTVGTAHVDYLRSGIMMSKTIRVQ